MIQEKSLSEIDSMSSLLKPVNSSSLSSNARLKAAITASSSSSVKVMVVIGFVFDFLSIACIPAERNRYCDSSTSGTLVEILCCANS